MRNSYYILRHGQTPFQAQKKGIVYPWPEPCPIRLTKKGKEQIEAAAKRLKTKKIDLIYSSDVPRASESAEIVARDLGVEVRFDPRLRDVDLGIYKGRPKKKFFQDFPDPKERFTKRPKGGESWNDVKERILKFIRDIDKKHQQKTILLVGHGDPLWLLEGSTKRKTEQELLEEKLGGNSIKVGEIRELKT